jgi:predicted ATPase
VAAGGGALAGVRPGELPLICLVLRGCLDGLAYCEYFGVAPPTDLLAAADSKCYDRVFVLDTLIDFMTRSDEGRTSTQDTSIALGSALEATYRRYGYQPVRVPVGPVSERVDAVLDQIAAA